MPNGQPEPVVRCTCADVSPTMPTYRVHHLPSCPAFALAVLAKDATIPYDVYVGLKAALKGYDVQYGEVPLAEQRPELPLGHVQRVEAVVRAARAALATLERLGRP